MTQSVSQPSSIPSDTAQNTVTVAAGTARIACDGGGGALGHPQVWLTLAGGQDGSKAVNCPYCSRHFVAPAS